MSRNTRVAVVIPTHWDFRMGGSQYQAKILIEQLYQGFHATIVYFTARASDNRQFADHQVVCVGRANALRRFGHFWDYFRLQKALRDFAPDVIYQRVGCAYTGISVRYSKRHRIPLIWHMASADDCSKAPSLVRLVARPHALIETHLARRAARHADVVIAQSQDQARLLHENFGRQADFLIRNFHDVPPARARPADPLTVLWIGNFKPVKRPELLLEVASLLRDSPEIRFIMIGLPYSIRSMQDQFEQLAQRCHNVRYLGAMPQEDVNKLLEHSHLLVNTSRSEGFSNTFIQAWMRSVPVLTLGVNPDGLLNNGFLGCSHGSTAGIADHIRRLFASPDILESTGNKAREFAIENFSMTNAVKLADLVIRTATDGRGKSKQVAEK